MNREKLYEIRNQKCKKKNRFLFKRNLHSGKKIKMKPNFIVVVVTMEKASSSSSSCMNHWLNMNRRLYVCGYIYRFVSFFFILSQCRFLKMRWKLKSFFFAHFEYQTHIHAHLNFSTHYRPIIHQKQKIRRWSTTRESKMIKKSIASIS